jgi:hypothetical protein
LYLLGCFLGDSLFSLRLILASLDIISSWLDTG